MNRSRICASAIAALLLAACTATAGQVSRAGGRANEGTVAGGLVLEGGPIVPGGQQPGQRPMPGAVTFAAAGRPVVTVKVGRSGTFTVRLQPGRYRVFGRSPEVAEVSSGAVLDESGKLLSGAQRDPPCSRPLSVTVAARHTTRIRVVCDVP
jgi:hypothetical protein